MNSICILSVSRSWNSRVTFSISLLQSTEYILQTLDSGKVLDFEKEYLYISTRIRIKLWYDDEGTSQPNKR